MDSEWQEQPKDQQHASTPGALLAAQREAMGFSVEQIADQLKLAQRQVVAIEKGDYAALPNMAVTRGFVRAYAKVVRMDPAPLVAMIEVEQAAGHEHATVRPTRITASFNESRFPSLTERQGKPIGAMVAGVAILALLGVVGAWKAGLITPAMLGARDASQESMPSEPVTPPLTVTTPGTLPAADTAPMQTPSVPLISVPPQPGSSTAPVGVPANAPVNGTVATPANAPANAAQQPTNVAPAATPVATPAAPVAAPTAAPTVAAPAAAPAAAPVAAPPVHGGTLVLKVDQDSWVELRRPGSPSLIARLVKAGNTETFEVREKDLLIVGKPSAVHATLRGAPLALPQVTGGTIARVNIQ
jgi:cytoskeleton protein RodZ